MAKSMKLITLQLQLTLQFICLLVTAANACVDTETGPTAQFVRETIAENKVVIFSKSYCQFSTMAKEQFQKLNFPFVAVELDRRPDGNRIQQILGALTDASTVPRVFVDGKFIGGGSDVKKLNDSGELKKLLKIQ